ncbi:hypothetical protein TCDM_12927 [Trypanosoma cruzi Dm28c]|uniref:Uncharacterized protein n=1 Tax=Trypanosoma cruzi Dm28c TaxID=1416333 RepID=V5CJR0_TRYCR|nr:hypothetical protein TCDM_12927 [Trypanosoma cruzi Dm28c]
MLGLRGSLSPPSLLLPLDPVTRRRLCVRGASTAATRENIQICVCGRCVCCWSFQCLTISQWRLVLVINFFPLCVGKREKLRKRSTTVNTASVHSEWQHHHHPRRSHPQQQLTHADTRNEKEDQCTGNTQRRSSPAAAGATPGTSLFVTRQHTLNNALTKRKTSKIKKHSRPSRHTRAAASRFTLVSSNAPAHRPAQPENPPSAYEQREEHVKPCSCWAEAHPQ